MSNDASVPAGTSSRLVRRLSPLGVWALSFGCSVGWGAFVMPGTTFLPVAGPLGTALGILIGAAVMLIIGVNYFFLMNRYPDAGGTFSYTKDIFGYDHGLLSAWFLGLVYLAIIWANATAIPLIFRGIAGDLLRFGYCYTIAGYEVYLGEILISLAAVLIFGFVCLRGVTVSSVVQIVMALLLAAGVLFAFFAVFFRSDAAIPDLTPLYSPQHSPVTGTFFIIFLAPWAFAGFESISHSVEEFKFSPKKTLRIMIVALLCAAAAYILLALLGAAAQPAGFSDWADYLRGLDDLSGVESLPTFYAVFAALGRLGLVVLGIAAAAAIITGLVGNMTAASRLLYFMARTGLLPASMGRLNRRGAPQNAILFLILISIPIPFLGRSAIGWIIDVNTIGVTIAYAYTSAAALKKAHEEKRTDAMVFGVLGITVSIFFLLYFLVPNFSSVSALSTESYLMLTAWALLGFVVFYLIFRRDSTRRMGASTTPWIVLLLLIFFTSTLWIIGTTKDATAAAVKELSEVCAGGLRTGAGGISALLAGGFSRVTGIVIRNSIIQMLVILLSLLIIFHTYSTVQKRHQTAVKDKTIAEQSNQAKSTFLSNMSHDIRTPMNAIIGYVTLARREKNLPPKTQDYLSKIADSSDHLLALINDILEMSRIESGRMELMPIPTDIRKTMDEVRNLFSTQMETKGLTYTVTCEDVKDSRILCDKNRLNRVLLNLISNAYKFTPEGGSVTVTLQQTGREGDSAAYRLSVKDTGIGMSPEFAAKVFEAYERERTVMVENIQGTGLGTAITKSIVELMGGSIQVFSEQGKGSEFVIDVAFPVDPEYADAAAREGEKPAKSAYAGLRVLLVEDDPGNRDVERILLEEAGFVVETAENGEDAVELIAASTPGDYAVVFMDIEMPVKNRYSASRVIRSLRNKELAEIPIVAMTARAFSEDIAAAKAAGMNGHIAKPVSITAVTETLAEILH